MVIAAVLRLIIQCYCILCVKLDSGRYAHLRTKRFKLSVPQTLLPVVTSVVACIRYNMDALPPEIIARILSMSSKSTLRKCMLVDRIFSRLLHCQTTCLIYIPIQAVQTT